MLIRVGKLQFICLIGGLIGGRVFNPRQQQVAYSRLVTISRCSSLLLPRVKNPPISPPIRQINCSLPTRINIDLKKFVTF